MSPVLALSGHPRARLGPAACGATADIRPVNRETALARLGRARMRIMPSRLSALGRGPEAVLDTNGTAGNHAIDITIVFSLSFRPQGER
jgi:predicted component of type VI protein secretion system